jgi:hypothetical protein
MRREVPAYRSEAVVLDSVTVRDLVRNWNPEADRSSNGYWKNVSLQTPNSGGSGSASSNGGSSTSSGSTSSGSSVSGSVDQY